MKVILQPFCETQHPTWVKDTLILEVFSLNPTRKRLPAYVRYYLKEKEEINRVISKELERQCWEWWELTDEEPTFYMPDHQDIHLRTNCLLFYHNYLTWYEKHVSSKNKKGRMNLTHFVQKMIQLYLLNTISNFFERTKITSYSIPYLFSSQKSQVDNLFKDVMQFISLCYGSYITTLNLTRLGLRYVSTFQVYLNGMTKLETLHVSHNRFSLDELCQLKSLWCQGSPHPYLQHVGLVNGMGINWKESDTIQDILEDASKNYIKTTPSYPYKSDTTMEKERQDYFFLIRGPTKDTSSVLLFLFVIFYLYLLLTIHGWFWYRQTRHVTLEQ